MGENATGIRLGMFISADEQGTRNPAETLAENVDRAIAARDQGFDSVAVGHRYSYGPANASDGSSLTTWRYQPLLMLAHLAAHLKGDVDYITGVMVSPSLHPVQLAEEVATLDTMCHGRLNLGVGLGWMPYEFEAFGVDFKTRARRFDELLSTYRALSTQPEVNSDGPYFPVKSASIVARGIQRPMPPLWLGASADRAVRRAARFSDAWIMSQHIDIPTLINQKKLFREERAAAGMPNPTRWPVMRTIVIDENRDVALEEIRPQIEDWYTKRGKWGWFLTEGEDTDVKAIGQRWIAGNPDDVIQQIVTLHEELGTTDIIFCQTFPSAHQERRLKTIDLVGRHVIPALREALTPKL